MNTIQINKPGNSTMVLVMAPTGAYYEDDKYKGISHFLEHMCFKGTKKRTREEINSTIENVGGDINAFTDWEVTAYWARVGNAYKKIAFDIIEDLVTNPIIPDKEVDKEREVIIQELKMGVDDAKGYTWDLFHSALYEKKSGFHISIIGTKESLYRIKQEDLEKYHNQYYKSNNLTKIIVGDVPNIEKFQMKSYNIKENFVNKNPKDKLVTRKDMTQANIIIGNSTKPFVSTQEGEILNWLLSSLYNDMSGRLFSVIREQNHLVYRIRFGIDYNRNREMTWSVSLGLDKKNIEKARKLIVQELIRPATKKEIETIINKTIGTLDLYLDDNIHIANQIAYFVTRNIDYKFFIYDYKKYIKQTANLINDYIQDLHFEKNVLAGVVGE
jgi:predicted Zn-dependent peptidase